MGRIMHALTNPNNPAWIASVRAGEREHRVLAMHGGLLYRRRAVSRSRGWQLAWQVWVNACPSGTIQRCC